MWHIITLTIPTSRRSGWSRPGKGREIVAAQKREAMQRKQQKTSMVTIIVFMIVALTLVLYISSGMQDTNIILIGIIAAAIIFFAMRYSGTRQESYMVPKLLITHEDKDTAPFIDATGAHAGALLGDVKHDPFQSGGLETPAHERLEVGAIHKASKGVLFIDEINMLRMESQQSLLTALQEENFRSQDRANARPGPWSRASRSRATS